MSTVSDNVATPALDTEPETEIRVTSVVGLEAANKKLLKGSNSRPTKLTFEKGTLTPPLDYSIEGLLKVISSASTDLNVRTMCIYQSFFTLFSYPATAERFCRAMGKIPSLRVLIFGGMEPCHVKHLALILEEAKQLTTLECKRINFGGTTRDFEDLGTSLHEHPTLQKVSFQSCDLKRRNRAPGCILPVLASLRTIPNMKELTVSCWIPTNHMTNEGDVENAWKDLCCHPNLSHFSLHMRVDCREHLKPTLAALQTSTSIKSVHLLADMLTFGDFNAFGQLLRNNPSLKRLSVRYLDISDGDGGETLLPLLLALESNTSLLVLSIKINCGDSFVPSSHTKETILSLLETKNSTLYKLYLHLKPDDEGNKQFLWQSEYYLTLNRSGGKNLLENPDAPPKHWLEALAKCGNNVPALFSLLSANPTLCSIRAVKRAEPSEGKDTRGHNQHPTKTPRIG